MARISSVIALSHTPFIVSPVSLWEQTRTLRGEAGGFAPTIPFETRAELEAKAERIARALQRLRAEVARVKPDVVVIFGDDQQEQFRLHNFPAISLYLGATFSGFKISPKDGPPFRGDWPARPKTAEHWATVAGHPQLAGHILGELTQREFDVALSTALPDPERGMGHAFMRVHTMLGTDYAIPTVPIWVNCYYGPQPTGNRCLQLGRAVCDIIADYPADLSVMVVGSGGLWHTPGQPGSILDEDFDRSMLAAVERGDAAAMAEYFDSRAPRTSGLAPEERNRQSGGTGIVTGLGSGTGETRNWIAAAACAAGRPGTVLDYIPIYASPVGVAFACWEIAR